MSRGHGIIINLSNMLPFIFTSNPAEVETQKSINYFEMPNIGGSHHELYFTGFTNKEVSLNLICIDMEDPLGVTEEISYFEALREPAPGWANMISMLLGNENFPPPQILFSFGVGSLVPLIYDMREVGITADLFFDDDIRGTIGVPRRAEISIRLSLDENNILNKANMIAKQASAIAGSVESILKEKVYKTKGGRKELPGLWK